MVQRSNLYASIFPEDLMMEAFGTTMPTQSAKNEYFFNCWMDWKNNELRTFVTIPPSTFKGQIKRICNSLGLKEFWDYQTRGYSVRFKDAEMLSFFKISTSAGDIKWTT